MIKLIFQMSKKSESSKTLSWLLRHGAYQAKIPISSEGFILVNNILKHTVFKGYTIDDIVHIVNTDEKQRFTLRENLTDGILEIRANQGHSLKASFAYDFTLARHYIFVKITF